MKSPILSSTLLACVLSTHAVGADIQHYKMEAWSDNWFSAYLDGEFLFEDSVSIKTERSFNSETYKFTAGNSFSLAFVLKDFKENDTGLEYIGSRRQQMGDGGFIMQVTNVDTGKIVAVSDSAMHCEVIHKAPLDSACAEESNPIAGQGACQFSALDEPDNWQSPSFDDSSWQYATEHSVSAVSPKDGYDRIKWDQQAKLVWGEDLKKDNTLLCRLSIDG
jgi:hypothetical protein